MGKTIMLACSAGMSTSILVKKMQDAAREKNVDVQIVAMPTTEAASRWQEADILLLGPQVRYELARFEKLLDGKIPVIVIDQMDYGMGRGDLVLEKALQIIN